jgi:hypothetical protein
MYAKKLNNALLSIVNIIFRMHLNYCFELFHRIIEEI